MSGSHSRTRALAAPLLIGLVALVSAACAPEPTPPPYYGIYFYPPSIGYVTKTYVPKATATSGLPVSFSLDATSTGCSLTDGVLSYEAVGTCVVNANQAGDETHAASAQVQRKIKLYDCPPLRSGVWTGPLNLSANVTAEGSFFTGTVDLSSLGYGVQVFAGSVSCEVAHMTFNNVPLTGYLSPDGSTLSSNYNGIDIVLYAPAA
jgi:hypothetical protein